MRRVLAILLMLLVPAQFAWSAMQSLHGHIGEHSPVAGFHSHANHDHHDGDLHGHDHDASAGADTTDASGDEGHHAEHYHPVFSTLAFDPDLKLAERSPDGPPRRPPASFTSHVPPPFDWPPTARV